MKRRLTGSVLFLALVVALGCDKGEKSSYANVSGTVKYNGQPIEKGKITFAIEGRPPQTMDIVDGKYAGSAMVGSNRIMVSAMRKGAVSTKDSKHAETQIKGYMEKKKGEFGGPPVDYDPSLVEYIPEEWGSRSTQTRVVESGAANNFDFEIKGPEKK